MLTATSSKPLSIRSGPLQPFRNWRSGCSSGSGWVLLTQLGIQLVGFTKSIVLARLLTPEDFGIFGIALIVFSVIADPRSAWCLLRPDPQAGYIQRRPQQRLVAPVDQGRPLCFHLVTDRSMFYRHYYQDYSFPLDHAFVGHHGFGTRPLQHWPGGLPKADRVPENLHNQFVLPPAGYGVSVYVALAYRSVLALSLGLLIYALAIDMLSFVIHPFRPRLQFNHTGYRALLSYGKWIWSGQIIVFLITEGDDIIVALLLGPASLGYYRMAYFLSNLPATQLTNTLGQVSFSAFSKVSSPTLFSCVTSSTGPQKYQLPDPPTVLWDLFAPTWVCYIRTWVKAGCRSSRSPRSWCFGALAGQSDRSPGRCFRRLISRIDFVHRPATATGDVFPHFPIAETYDLPGVALAVVISGLVQVPISLSPAQKITRFHWSKLILLLGKPLIGSSLMFLALEELKTSYWAVDSLLEIVLIACVGLVLYVFVMQLFQYGGISLKRIFSIRQPIV